MYRNMTKKNQYLLRSAFIAQTGMGIYLLLIGSILPMLQKEYHLGYQLSGAMMSMQSVGYLIVGSATGLISRYLGPKLTFLGIGNLAFLGLILMMFTGNPIVLLLAMIMNGASKGCSANFGNQITNNLSRNDPSLMNMMQAFFAIGACMAPFIAMICGSSWRMASGITVGIGAAIFLYSFRIEIGPDAYRVEEKTVPDFGFFRKKVFWICTLMLTSYLTIESSIMGWLVTFLVDSQMASETVAQIVSMALWIALMVGRFACVSLARRFQTQHMLVVMAGGIVVFYTMLVYGQNLAMAAIAAVGLGLFMAGLYGTALSGTENILDRYPMCMGMFIMIPGLVSAGALGLIGLVADQMGLRSGMKILYVIIAVLILANVWNMSYQKKRKG